MFHLERSINVNVSAQAANDLWSRHEEQSKVVAAIPDLRWGFACTPLGDETAEITMRLEGDEAADQEGVARRLEEALQQFKERVESLGTEMGVRQDSIPAGQVRGGTSIGRESRPGDNERVIGGNTSPLVGGSINGLGGAPDRGDDSGVGDLDSYGRPIAEE